MLLAFTAIVLVGAVVPLTLNATSHDRNSFSQAAAGTARTDAVLAQAELIMTAELAVPKHKKPSASATAQATFSLLTIVKEARQAGDSLLVLTSSGQQVIDAAMPAVTGISSSAKRASRPSPPCWRASRSSQ